MSWKSWHCVCLLTVLLCGFATADSTQVLDDRVSGHHSFTAMVLSDLCSTSVIKVSAVHAYFVIAGQTASTFERWQQEQGDHIDRKSVLP